MEAIHFTNQMYFYSFSFLTNSILRFISYKFYENRPWTMEHQFISISAYRIIWDKSLPSAWHKAGLPSSEGRTPLSHMGPLQTSAFQTTRSCHYSCRVKVAATHMALKPCQAAEAYIAQKSHQDFPWPELQNRNEGNNRLKTGSLGSWPVYTQDLAKAGSKNWSDSCEQPDAFNFDHLSLRQRSIKREEWETRGLKRSHLC